MKCAVCHVEAAAGAAFCPQCGAKLPRPDAAGHASTTARSAETAPAEKAQTASGPPDPAAVQAVGGGRRRAADVPEETLWEGRYSPKAKLGAIVGSALASVALIVLAVMMRARGWWMLPLAVMLLLWIAVLGRLAVNRLGVYYKLTNQMFYHQNGILTRVTNRIEVIDIDDVTFSQNLFDRMVNVGTIKVVSSDRTHPMFWMPGIEHVDQVAKTIDRARRAERIRRGMSVESLSYVPGSSDGV